MRKTTEDQIPIITAAIVRECKAEIERQTGLGQELQYRIGLQLENDDDPTADYALALFDVEQWIVGSEQTKTPMFREVHELKLRSGLIREMTDKELEGVTVVGGRGKASLYYKHAGKKWTQDWPDCYFYNSETSK